MTMAMLTLEIDDAKLARAREAAALRQTTVEGWLAEQVDRLVPVISPDQQAAIERIIARSNAWAGRAVSTKVTREETYDRDISGPW